MYKLLFTDLDDTLLGNEGDLKGKVSFGNKSAIKSAIAQGYHIIICSGRSSMSLKNFSKELEINDYTIGYNGGIIFKDEEIAVCHYLDAKLVKDIISFSKEFKINLQLYQENGLWIDEETLFTKTYATKQNLVPHLVDDLSNHITDKVNKVIVLENHQKLREFSNALPNYIKENCCTFFSHEYLFEFNPLNVTKGTAVEELSSILNIPLEQTIAIGDNENDIDMLKSAGLSVAVKNAISDLTEQADYITQNDCNNNAVAEVINKFLLSQ